MFYRWFIGVVPYMVLSGCVAGEVEVPLDGELADDLQGAEGEPAGLDEEGAAELKAEHSVAENPAAPAVLLVSPAAKWKYLVQPGANPYTPGPCKDLHDYPDWAYPYYDDYEWGEGYAELGYGEYDERSAINAGPYPDQKCITQYFRHTFEVKKAADIQYMVVRILRDDGAVVYLNGYEIVRSNLPDGYIDAYTPAKWAVGGADEKKFVEYAYIPTSYLTDGYNTIAVEVHQSSKTDGDLSFAIELLGVLDDDHPDRRTFSFASKEATIDESVPNTRLGSSLACKADGASGESNSDPSKEQVCLAQWDLKGYDLYYEQIPPYSRVVAAHVVARVVNTSLQFYDVFPVLTRWVEKYVTWNDSNGALAGDWETGKFSGADLADYPVSRVNGPYKATQEITLPPELVQEWLDDPYSSPSLAIYNLKNVDGLDFAADGDGLKLVVTVEPEYVDPG